MIETFETVISSIYYLYLRNYEIYFPTKTNYFYFRYNISEAWALIKIALQILNQWKTQYFNCKNDIEVLSIRYCTRWAWDFNEDILFNRINFVSDIVYDLDKIMEVKLN